jgi:3-hydroxyacyl-CoA dehydrogenase
MDPGTAQHSSSGAPSPALLHLEASERLANSVPGMEGIAPRAVNRVAVIGAGTMGSGIAVSLADAGIVVDLLEQDAAAASAGRGRVEGLYAARVKRGRLSEEAVAERLTRIQVSDDWTAVSTANMVIEAAFEDMGVKSAIFGRLDALARPGAVLATNTSYLDVDAIAAATARPGDVVGLHFFSPAHIMRLLEVVQAGRTEPDVLATALALGRRIGKLPIVARNCDGFIGNRIFAAYRRHAEYLLEDGASPEEIDGALVEYGFAMGPFAVSDMSGLDIAWAMRKRRAATRDPGERYVAIPDLLCEAGRLGRKTGHGWYDYEDGKARPSQAVHAVIAAERARRGVQARRFAPEAIRRRILAVMANEGARVLEEGVSLRPSDIDLVFVNGYGFPRAEGGPMFAADRMGLPAVLAEVEDAARTGGAGSGPAELLVRLSQGGGSFAAWQARAALRRQAPALQNRDALNSRSKHKQRRRRFPWKQSDGMRWPGTYPSKWWASRPWRCAPRSAARSARHWSGSTSRPTAP